MRCFSSRTAATLLAVVLVAPIVRMAAAEQTPSAPDARAAAVAPTNINTATVEQLDKLPGIGPKVAALIIAHRQKNGNFKKIEELMNIKGIGEKAFLKLKPLVTVTAPPPGMPRG